MALFKVTGIIDGNTITTQGWQWGDYKGKDVIVSGIPAPSSKGSEYANFAKGKLQLLLQDKQIELRGVTNSQKREGENNDIITCSVYLNDIDISQYFPEFTT